MKRILILNLKHHLENGGVETYTKQLINLLLSHNYKVFEINRSFIIDSNTKKIPHRERERERIIHISKMT